MLDIRSNICPLKSKNSMVFLKVGSSALLAIASISCQANSIPLIKAGLKCSFFISENGAVKNGVLKGNNKGLLML